MKWFSRDKKATTLAVQLADYPAYEAPHTGNHLSLTETQALENLAYLHASKSSRIDILHGFVAQYGIDLRPAITNGRHRPMIDALYQWAQSEWEPAVSADIVSRSVWRTTNRQAGEIIYSLVMDCAIALGEVVVQHRPAYAWGVDLDPDNLQEQMPSACRVVLQAPSVLHPGQVVIVDWEELAVAMLLNPHTTANRAINLWQRVCDEAISGATQGDFAFC